MQYAHPRDDEMFGSLGAMVFYIAWCHSEPRLTYVTCLAISQHAYAPPRYALPLYPLPQDE